MKGFAYGTSSVVANPGNVAPTVSGYSTNSTTYSSTLGAYSSNVTGMAAGTTYYVRAWAHNGIGYAYGDEVTFTTMTTPTATTLAASNVASTTARLNSQVTYDGNSSCNITFGWGLVSHAADWSLYTVKTNVSGNYNTGTFSYLDLTSTNTSSTYYFNVRIQNPYGTAYGTEQSFTTTSGVSEPTSLLAISASTQISVSWVKNSASSTMVRYSTGTYPTTTAQGTLAYLGTGASCLITGLSEGVTYYISAWGVTGGVYSAAYAYTLATTTAYTTATQPTISTPVSPGTWGQATDSTSMASLPFYPIVSNIATAYDMPVNTLWYIGWILAAVVIGIFAYNRGSNNLTAAIMASAGMMLLGTFGAILAFEAIAIALGIMLSLVVLIGRY
jgi:hypothetical protein